MITKWEDIPGVKKVYYGTFSGVTLVFEEGSFAVVVGEQGYEGEAYAVLAGENNEDALLDAVQAGAPGARGLLDAAKTESSRAFEMQERERLAYLLEKYEEV